jgi:hexaprenyl-diphosphate synthase
MSIFSGLVSSLVEGELLQADEIEDWESATREDDSITLPDWEVYLTKTYLKTGSLISKALRCSALLNVPGGEDNLWVDAAAAYGTELGMAFQVGLLACGMLDVS